MYEVNSKVDLSSEIPIKFRTDSSETLFSNATDNCSRRFSASRIPPLECRAISLKASVEASIFSNSQIDDNFSTIWSIVILRKSNRWHLEMIVAGTL